MKNNLTNISSFGKRVTNHILRAAPASRFNHSAKGGFVFKGLGSTGLDTARSRALLVSVITSRAFFCARKSNHKEVTLYGSVTKKRTCQGLSMAGVLINRPRNEILGRLEGKNRRADFSIIKTMCCLRIEKETKKIKDEI